ncbi:Guanine nucleotide-binding protein subunit alpha [Hondaea fermentalgiana]|uniref:Guanine nucleotide-binding protein subunit alpha n=1 Tax=Hondaea fermentalgiana TaxID=2315210 RepID=A0A2R5GNY2_9STRA|nr:Guanine nucleotide-binding protein subunit alpha [Hondaea fermentalgiana]|eukprot:GBG32325.1 Guanine nucleotide-binding protein subunit alpha [Hondaea fermentalgiana]
MTDTSGTKLSEAEVQEKRRDQEIARANAKDRHKDRNRIKLLLLGAGESGKSTIFKQMKLLYGQNKGFTESELSKAALTIYSNVISDFQEVLTRCAEFGPYDPSLKESAEAVLLMPFEAPTAYIDASMASVMKNLWADEGVQQTWAARANFQVQDALANYMAKIEEIGKEDYVPTTQDVLLTRVRTSGIVEDHFLIEGVEFVMFDVGGQRNERRKWIHCFEDVTAVIFVAAINEYDQVLYEDNKVNRMDEAVILFEEICNSKWFTQTSMILFLNKADLFREKLVTSPFRVDQGPDTRFLDFAGPVVVPGTKSAEIGTPEYEACYEAAAEYCLELFVSRKKNPNKRVYHHITTATDSRNINTVFDACRDIILKSNLLAGGFFDASDKDSV